MLRLCITLLAFTAAQPALAERIIVPPQYVVDIANRLEYQDFPKTVDILAIIRVESAFKPSARNPEASSPVGPSNGLMQVQNGSFDVNTNMRQGVGLLREYYIRLGRNKEAAVKSYNIGIGRYKRGGAKISAEVYWSKFKKRRSEYVRYYKKYLMK